MSPLPSKRCYRISSSVEEEKAGRQYGGIITARREDVQKTPLYANLCVRSAHANSFSVRLQAVMSTRQQRPVRCSVPVSPLNQETIVIHNVVGAAPTRRGAHMRRCRLVGGVVVSTLRQHAKSPRMRAR